MPGCLHEGAGDGVSSGPTHIDETKPRGLETAGDHIEDATGHCQSEDRIRLTQGTYRRRIELVHPDGGECLRAHAPGVRRYHP